MGRLDDINQDGMEVVRELVSIIELHDLGAEVLAASMRHPRHMTEAALAGAHVATVPFKVLQQMVHHPLTDKGIVQFRKDWESARHASTAGAAKTKSALTRSGPAEARRPGCCAGRRRPRGRPGRCRCRVGPGGLVCAVWRPVGVVQSGSCGSRTQQQRHRPGSARMSPRRHSR